MTNAQILQFVLGIVASGAFGAVVVALFNRGKTKAETEQIASNVYKTLNADLLAQLKDAKEELGKLNVRIEHMEEKDEAKELELLAKNKRIGELERRVDDLESELRKYKTLDESIDIVKDTLHVKIDEAAEQVKSNIKQENDKPTNA